MEEDAESSDDHKDIARDDRLLPFKVSSEIYCIEIFHSVLDTSQSFKIHKLLVKEESIKTLKECLPKNLKIVSLYGMANVIMDCLNKAFETKIKNFPTTEGIYLFYNPVKKRGALTFITENEDFYRSKSTMSSNPFVTIIRTLTDLSFKIIACLSDDIIGNWFYEENGTLNPFKPKVHDHLEINLIDVSEQESRIESIEVKHFEPSSFYYFITKDNLDMFFSYNFVKISKTKRKDIKKDIKSMGEKLVKTNDVQFFYKEFTILLKKLETSSFKVEDLKNELKTLYENLIYEKEKSVNDLLSKLSTKIEKLFLLIPIDSAKQDEFKRLLESELKSKFKNCTCDGKKFSNMIANAIGKKITLRNEYLDKKIEVHYKKNKKCETHEDLEKNLNDIVEDLFGLDENEMKKTKPKVKKMIEDLTKKKSLNGYQNLIHTLKDNFHELNLLVLNKIITSKFEGYKEKVSKIEKSFEENYHSHLKDIEKSSSGLEFILEKNEFKVSETRDKKLISTISQPRKLFQLFFPTKKLAVSQIISLEPEVIFVLISNQADGKTHVLRFNPKITFKEDFEKCKDIDDSEVFLSWGSSANKFIMFQNKNKIATHGSLKQNKYFEKGIELNIYLKIENVVSSFYLKKSRKLIIIDNNGLVYSKDLVNEENELNLVNSNKRISGSESELEPLRPKSGNKFHDIDISSDENIILLRTDVDIEIYDKNFELIQNIPTKQNFKAYKSFIIENKCFLVIQNTKNKLEFMKLVVPKHETQIEYTKKINKIIDGNPIFDLHHLGIMKFGPLVEDTQIIKGQRYLGYYSLGRKNDKVEKYLKCLKEVKNNFDLLGFIIPKKLFNDLEKIELSKVIFSVSVRIPLHIASIQKGNLVPLQNGINNFEEFTTKIEKESFLESLTDYIRFGNYEEILENLNNLLVISVIGRQSSGKSYLLNRIAGTRFDVSAERCTEGIWMGIGFIGETPLVVFDCEGLFTVERSTQEEIKLCLFISSLSDIIILNSDRSSTNHIKGLFDDFSMGVDRLKGKNLFRGCLDITYRDIPDNQSEGANIDFKNFVQNLIETGRKESLSKLFSKRILNSLYHNFENSMFDEEVSSRRNFYIENIKTKWSSETKLCLMMKLILVQIFLDDIISLDIRMFSAQTRKLRALIDDIISKKEVAKKLLKNESFNFIIEKDSNRAEFNLVINQFKSSESEPLKYFFSSTNESSFKNFCRKNHDFWYEQFDELIKEFFCARKTLITNFYIDSLPKSEEFKEQIGCAWNRKQT